MCALAKLRKWRKGAHVNIRGAASSVGGCPRREARGSTKNIWRASCIKKKEPNKYPGIIMKSTYDKYERFDK